MNLKIKLALNNLRKNKSIFLPYILLISLTDFLLFSIINLHNNTTLATIRGYRSINQLLTIALPLFVFFFFLLIYNVSSFCYKFRSKTYGLYHVLGLSKKDIIQVYLIEVATSLVIGLGMGTIFILLFDQAIYTFIMNLLKTSSTLLYQLNVSSLLISYLFVSGLVLLAALLIMRRILKANSIELLKDENQGERKPTYNLIIALLGIGLLSSAYWYASQIDAQFLKEENILQLFISILAVILATFMIFVSSSVWILSLLKKNKSFFYQSNRFIIVSNLLFRLKKNAFSLAGITLFSTMAIFVSSITSIFVLSLNQPQVLEAYDIQVSVDQYDEFEAIDFQNQLIELNQFESIKSDVIGSFATLQISILDNLKPFDFYDENQTYLYGLTYFEILSLDDLNRLLETNYVLEPHQLFVAKGKFEEISLDARTAQFQTVDYTVKESLDLSQLGFISKNAIVMNQNEIDGLQSTFSTNQMNAIQSRQTYLINLVENGQRVDDEQYFKIIDSFKLPDSTDYGYSINPTRANQDEINSIFSGLLYIGFYFILNFILSLFSLLYFKFYQEALEDQKRFVTLQQVGLTPYQTKSVVNQQIQILFFLPLVLSIIHIFFARKGIEMIQVLFGSTNTDVRTHSILISLLLFMLIYIMIYFVIKKVVLKIIGH